MSLMLNKPVTLAELAIIIDAELSAVVDPDVVVDSIQKLETAEPGSVSFCTHASYHKLLAKTNASAVLLSATEASACKVPVLISVNPRLSLAKLLNLCIPNPAPKTNLIHPTAVIGANVTLGDNVQIGPNCSIGDNCILGDNTVLKSNVVLYHDVVLGKNCTVHSGTVIGSDGFGYAIDAQGNWVKMPHLGGVVVGDDVEIGSNTSIDRGMIDNTVIGNRVIIDNLVQIGHNVSIGDNTAIAGCVGIAGSAVIGKYCLIGGAANIAGHISLADKVHITATSAVSNTIAKAGVYSSGLPARENSDWRRSVARFLTIDSMAKRIRDLEKIIVTGMATNNTNHGYKK